LIDAMQTYEGIEHEQARLQFGDGLVERPAVALEVEPHGRSGDHLYVEICESDACGGADALDPPTHDVERVLGGIEQNAPSAWDDEAAQACRAGGNCDGEIEREEGFAAFGLA